MVLTWATINGQVPNLPNFKPPGVIGGIPNFKPPGAQIQKDRTTTVYTTGGITYTTGSTTWSITDVGEQTPGTTTFEDTRYRTDSTVPTLTDTVSSGSIRTSSGRTTSSMRTSDISPSKTDDVMTEEDLKDTPNKENKSDTQDWKDEDWNFDEEDNNGDWDQYVCKNSSNFVNNIKNI